MALEHILHPNVDTVLPNIATTRELDMDLDRLIFAKGYSLTALKLKYSLIMAAIEEKCEPAYKLLTYLGLPRHVYNG